MEWIQEVTTTFVELAEKLKQLDEITLMELLEVSSEDLVERFADIIDLKYDSLLEKVED